MRLAAPVQRLYLAARARLGAGGSLRFSGLSKGLPAGRIRPLAVLRHYSASIMITSGGFAAAIAPSAFDIIDERRRRVCAQWWLSCGGGYFR